MAFALFGFGEKAGRFDHQLHAKLLPGQIRRVLGADHEHLVSVHDEHVIFECHFADAAICADIHGPADRAAGVRKDRTKSEPRAARTPAKNQPVERPPQVNAGQPGDQAE